MNPTTRTLDFNFFKEHPEIIRYMDTDIAIVDNLNSMLETGAETFKTECFLMTFCLEGEISLNLNKCQYNLPTDHCAIVLPGSHIGHSPYKKPYTVRIVAFSKEFYASTIKLDPNTWNIIQYLYKNPILPMHRKESYKMYLLKELTVRLIDEPPHPFSHLVKHHFFASVFCEMLAHLHEHIPHTEKMDYNRTRQSAIFRQFMEEVATDDGTHRTVSYYANRLCYSAKHLSTVIKQFSGKTPISIINEHAILKIKHQLKHSDMSIKEVADYFDFVNPSFFGKFVKQHTGMSPLQYRLTGTEE